MKHLYAIRVHHRRPKNDGSSSAWDRYKKSQEEQLLRTEQDFLTLASSLASELPYLDLDYSSLDDCLCSENDDDIGHDYGFRATQFSCFLESMLTIPEVVSSQSLTQFFSPVDDAGDLNNHSSQSRNVHEEQQHQHFYQYVIADCDAVSIDLPVRGTYVHYEELPLNSFIIWSVHVESSTNGVGPVYPLQFKVSIMNDSISVCGKEDGMIRVVYEEALNREEKADFVGSFQYTDEKKQGERSSAATERANISLLFSNGNFFRHVRAKFKVKVVGKEVYEVACLAAKEQNIATNRKDNAPLLRELLDSAVSSDPVKILVEKDLEPQDTVHNELSREVVNCKREAAQESLRRLKCERKLGSIEKEMQDTQKNLNAAMAEKRIWSKSKNTIYEEVSKLSTELESEKRAHLEYKEKFSDSVQEIRLLRAELSMLRGKSREIAMLREELETKKIQSEESHESQIKLEKEVNKLRKDNERLEGKRQLLSQHYHSLQ